MLEQRSLGVSALGIVRVVLAYAVLAMVSGISVASESPDPLFATSAPLSIVLEGPFEEIDKRRDKEAGYPPGVLRYLNDSGREVALDVSYSPRGNYRLDKSTCKYAQLWLNLKKKQAKGTLFDHQNKLKLVVQCRGGDRYKELLAREYQAYLLLNVLTPNSFRVRWVTVSYRDLEGNELREHSGMLVEHRKRLAKRQDLEALNPDSVPYTALEQEHTAVVSMFMYMISNIDFSLIASREGACCHNAKVFQEKGSEQFRVIPYDFDSSGYVKAPYAQPNPDLKQRHIRQRVYRGFCVDDRVLETTIARFAAKRELLLAVAADTSLVSARTAKDSRSYLESFFEDISDPKIVEKKIKAKCRG